MKNAVFWNVTLCDYFNSGRFGEKHHIHDRMTGTGEIGTMLRVTSNRRTLRRNTETAFFTWSWTTNYRSVSLIWYHASKTLASKVTVSVFLTWAVDGGEWSAFSFRRFTPKKEPQGWHWLGGWVGHSVSLDTMKRRSFSVPGNEVRSGTISGTSNIRMPEIALWIYIRPSIWKNRISEDPPHHDSSFESRPWCSIV
jgi:hypothetical protein